jgi:hypothetical protein
LNVIAVFVVGSKLCKYNFQKASNLLQDSPNIQLDIGYENGSFISYPILP